MKNLDLMMEETFSPLFPCRRWLFWRKCRCVNDYVLRLRGVCEVCLVSSFFSACAWYVFFLCDVLKALDTSCAAMPCKVSCMARRSSVGYDAVFSLLVRPDRYAFIVVDQLVQEQLRPRSVYDRPVPIRLSSFIRIVEGILLKRLLLEVVDEFAEEGAEA